MDNIFKTLALTSLILLILVFIVPRPHLSAMTQIVPDAKVEGNPQHITEIIGTFDRAQEAIRAQDLGWVNEIVRTGLSLPWANKSKNPRNLG